MINNKFAKQLISSILAASFIFTSTSSLTFANSLSKVATKTSLSTQISTTDYQIPKQLEQDFKSSIASVYGQDKVETLYSRILEIIKDSREKRDPKLLQDDKNRSSDWYKEEIVYMFYADEFGVKDKNSKNTFKGLISMLDYLKDLGVTTLYMLPFMDSPMGDAGFDVRDPKNVRKDLGGMKEFNEFVAEAKKRGFKIKADLILNHFSDQHKWFQEALKGDLNKLNYFVVLDKPPVFKKYRDEQRGYMVDYTEDDGSITSRRLIFPDICENHYRKVAIKGKDYYVYHTFYPFQLDINWKNSEVLYEILNTIAYWDNIGIDIFRMDAIPFFIKEKNTDGEKEK